MKGDHHLILAQTIDSSDINIVDQTTKKLNTFQRFWANINWDKLSAVLIEKAIILVIVFLIFYAIRKIGGYLIDRSFASQTRKITGSISRINTIHTLTLNVFSYTVFFFFLYAILETIGIPVGSLLAGAGIAGLAIGLGAQGFMNDIITGFFIILEQQIDVGDYIRLANLNIEGKVTSVGIRTIQLKSIDGTVHFIPNRNITTISNLSRANMQVSVDVRINPNEGYEEIIASIQKINDTFAQTYKEEIIEGPTIFGMVDLGNGNYAIRTTMYVVNGKQTTLKEIFLATYVKTLTESGFSIPNTPIVPLATK